MSISESMSKIMGRFMSKRITANDIENAANDIKDALIDADVSQQIAKTIFDKIKEINCGEKIDNTVSGRDLVIRRFYDVFVEYLSVCKDNHALDQNSSGKKVVLMLGLQGVGKTTTTAKIAKFFKDKYKRNVLMIPVDMHRKAAIEQLKSLGKKNSIDVFDTQSDSDVLTVLKDALKTPGYDTFLIDTAGRQHVDQDMLNELKIMAKISNPTDKILVLNSMMGQKSFEAVDAFNNTVGLTHVVLTCFDSDTRGGAVLSAAGFKLPIKFMGTGESIDDLELFHPDRIAGRILGMGDIKTLVESTEGSSKNIDTKDVYNSIQDGSFNMNHMLTQLNTLENIGGLKKVMKFLPSGMKNAIEGNVSEKEIKTFKSIIGSMTLKERVNPGLVENNRHRISRIYIGSGTSASDVIKLIRNFGRMKKSMSKIKKVTNDLAGSGASFDDLQKKIMSMDVDEFRKKLSKSGLDL